MDPVAQSPVAGVPVVVAVVVDKYSHQVEGIVAAVAALGAELLGVAVPILHLVEEPAEHLLVAGAGHAAADAEHAAADAGCSHVVNMLVFFCLQGGFGERSHWVCPEALLAMSKVSPLLVDVAFGMNAQQLDVCF